MKNNRNTLFPRLQIYHELVNQSNYGTPDYYQISKSDTTGGGKNMTYDFVSDNTSVRTPLTLNNRVNGHGPLVFGGTNHDGNTAAGSNNKFYKKFFVPLPFFFYEKYWTGVTSFALWRRN